MPGTAAGAAKAMKTLFERHPGHHARIGAKGGANSSNGGFASDVIGNDGLTGRERARIAGAKGGAKSRRNKTTFTMADEIGEIDKSVLKATTNA